MDFVALGKHTLAFSSSLFDVVSDVINSLNFLGYYNIQNGNITLPGNETFVSENLFLQNNNSSLYNITDTRIIEDTNNVHEIWGIISMVFVFLPGIIGGLIFAIIFILMGILDRDYTDILMALFGVFLSGLFPLAFLIVQLGTIIFILLKRKPGTHPQFILTCLINLESSVESVGQLCLQLFTLLYGYPSNMIQKITIATSFFQIARCSILNDMEARLFIDDEKISFGDSIKETFQRLPTYISTIIFRVASLVLCMAYLRIYAIVPMIVLIMELFVVAWIRYRNNDDIQILDKLCSVLYLVFSNIGVLNTYTIFNYTG